MRRLEVFGSILRDDFNNDRSDVDVLVEFDQQNSNSFSNFLDLKESLEALFGRSVDLVELRAIRNKRLRYYINKSKSPLLPARFPTPATSSGFATFSRMAMRSWTTRRSITLRSSMRRRF